MTLEQILKRTPQGRAILAKLNGQYTPELLGAFLPGLKKAVKKIGKITRPITTAAAKVAAGAFGIPPGAIDKLAKIDPTAHRSLVAELAKTDKGQKAGAILYQQSQPKEKTFEIKPVHLAIGAGGAAVVILLIALSARR